MRETADSAAGAGGGDAPSSRTWTLEDIAERLRSLRAEAGHPSYAEIANRIGRLRARRGVPASEQKPARATVYDCFRTDRRRLDTDLVVEIARALGADDAAAAGWAQACRVAQSQADAATVVTAYAALPSGVSTFVGRADALATILETSDHSPASAVFSIEGMPGSGKSQLAIEAARRLVERRRVADVLYADLRGFHPENPPADPAAVLAVFLRLLGVSSREIPSGVDQRLAEFRAQLRSTRRVVILDDAAGAAQVVPLLPGDSGSVVLITSRTQVAEAAGAVQIPLSTFTVDESIALLRGVAGTDVVDQDIASATELSEASGCLPLAVGLTATRVAARPGWSLSDHVQPLLQRRRSLRLDDAVGATLDLSYATLSSRAQRTLRLLAVHPCADLDEPAITALTGRDPHEAGADLRVLVAHHLVTQARPHRYSLHSLVRTYALDRSYDDDRPAEREVALERLYQHYLGMVWSAYSTAHAPTGRRNRQPPQHVVVSTLDESVTLPWLEANIDNVLTLAHHAPELNRPDLITHLAEGVSWWLNRYGRYRDARLLHQLALEVAVSRGERVSEARANLDLGQILVRLTEWDPAIIHLDRAQRAFEAMGDMYGASSAVNAMAIIEVHRGRLAEGIELFQRSAELSRAAGNGHGTATALDNTAIVLRRAGRLDEAEKYHRMALAEATRIGDRYMQATGLTNVSEVQLLLGRRDEALQSARRGLQLGKELSNMPTIAYGNDNIGNILSADGDYENALRHHREALALSHQTGDRHLEAGVLNNLGTDHHRMGDHGQARSHYDDAHALSTKIGDTFEEARALDGIGAVCAAQGAADDARQYWSEALAIFEQLGSPEAAQVRDRLAQLAVHKPDG
ncbi:tetratricopeptide repeat protein [Phytoactinopolyspora alkaliphila]|uniref:Tetratricopeptide repeat protein n=1 Tax=Phytoactinopolyspora alkaliphila TaxID=1783498 RepID=A0A6N9YSM3_9ACTN|nr:tetratricopeptide repeat protein [Phytoactinopolyspora alkaliphila]NED98043.1 tetratricopeptide repeat protein [Phytoactinopolyspora alkaliphila]